MQQVPAISRSAAVQQKRHREGQKSAVSIMEFIQYEFLKADTDCIEAADSRSADT